MVGILTLVAMKMLLFPTLKDIHTQWLALGGELPMRILDMVVLVCWRVNEWNIIISSEARAIVWLRETIAWFALVNS